jgi:hypothetical protein
VASDEQIKLRYDLLKGHFSERQLRLILAAEARALGHGGISAVSKASGISRPTIYQGLDDLDHPEAVTEHARRKGAGRKRILERSSETLDELEGLLEPDRNAEPDSPLRWTTKSFRQLSDELKKKGCPVSFPLIGELLKQLGFQIHSLQTTSNLSQTDQDAQFRYIKTNIQNSFVQGDPILAMSSKRLLISRPARRNGSIGHSEVDTRACKKMETNHDCVRYALTGLFVWWVNVASRSFAPVKRLLLCFSSEGTGASITQLWKSAFQGFSNNTGIELTLCYLPPATFRWTQSERYLDYRLLTHAPHQTNLIYEATIDFIGPLPFKIDPAPVDLSDPGCYLSGMVVPGGYKDTFNIQHHSFNSRWNYTVRPGLK